MDSQEAADLIAGLTEEKAEHEHAERFRNRAAVLIAALAAMLAIGGLGGGNATDDLIGNNIHASDTWAFFQAKNMRQTIYEVAAEDLEVRLSDAQLAPELRQAEQARLAAYKANIARYDSEPDPEAPNDLTRGEGKRELRARAEQYEAAREQAAARDDNFDLAEIALQLAVVTGSVALLTVSRALLGLCAALGVIGTLLVVNGFTLAVSLPG